MYFLTTRLKLLWLSKNILLEAFLTKKKKKDLVSKGVVPAWNILILIITIGNQHHLLGMIS
jgi:hypothetical protein